MRSEQVDWIWTHIHFGARFVFALLLVIVVLSSCLKVLHTSSIDCASSTCPIAVRSDTCVLLPEPYKVVRLQPIQTSLLPATAYEAERANSTV